MKKLTTLMLAAAPFVARADGADFVEKAMPGVATAIVFSSVIAIVAIVYYSAHRARSLRHATVRYALEKGVAPPVELLEEGRSAVDDVKDLRRGLTLLGLGLGLMLTILFLPNAAANEAPWSLGFIPALVGLGYLVTWFVRGRPLGVRA
ncbi:MAG: DUF6249 domain-containing protein [Anaeromyxobacteraceae bacterium]